MGKAGIQSVGYPPLFCTEAKERRPAARSQPPCVSHLIVGMFAHFWSTGPLQPPPKRAFPAPICGMTSVVDTLRLSQTPTTSQSRGKARM
jgi:hypothetical protein